MFTLLINSVVLTLADRVYRYSLQWLNELRINTLIRQLFVTHTTLTMRHF